MVFRENRSLLSMDV
jgi:hypothetical protein